MAAFHAFFKDIVIKSRAYKTPEAVINLILSERYRVNLENGFEAIQILRKLGTWISCIKEFEKKYGEESA